MRLQSDSARLLAISVLLLVPSGNLAKPRHVNEQRREYKYQSSTKVVGSTSGGHYSSNSGGYSSSSNDLSPWAQSHLDEVNNMAERLQSEYNLQSHGGSSQHSSFYSSSSNSASGQLGGQYSAGSTLNYGSFTGKTQEELDLLAKEMTEQMLADMKTGKLVYTQISEPNYFQHQAAEKLEALSREQNMQVQQQMPIGGGYHKTTEKKHYEYSSTINGYQPRPTYATEVESLNQHEEHSKVMYPPTVTIGGGSQILQRKNCSATIQTGNVVVGQPSISGCSRVISSSQQASDSTHSQQGIVVPVYQGSYFQGSTTAHDHNHGSAIIPTQQTSSYEYQKHQHESQNHSPTYVRPATASSSHQESSSSQSWKEQQARQHIPVSGSHTVITSSTAVHDHKHTPTVMPTTHTTSFEYQKHDHETQKHPTTYVLPATVASTHQESSSSQSWKEQQAQQHIPISGSHTVITSSTNMHDHKHTPTVMPTTQTTSFEYQKHEHETQKHIPTFAQSSAASSSHQESSSSQTWKEQQAHTTSGGKHSIYEFLEKDKEHVPNYDSQVIMNEKTIETINAEANRYKPHVTVVHGEQFKEETESHKTQTETGQVQQKVVFPEFTFEQEHIEGDKTSHTVVPGSLIQQTTKEQHESNVQYRPNYPTSHTRQRNETEHQYDHRHYASYPGYQNREQFNKTHQYTGGYQQTYPVYAGGKTEVTDSTASGNRTVYHSPGYGRTVSRNSTVYHSGEGGNTVHTQLGSSLTTSEMEARNSSYYHRPSTVSQGNTEYYRESYYGSPHSISSSQANITREEGETHTHHMQYPHSITGSETYETAEEYSSHRPGQPGYVVTGSYNKTSSDAQDMHHHTHSQAAGHGYTSTREEGHASHVQHQGQHNQHQHGMHSTYERNMNASSGLGIGYLTYEGRRILEEAEERRRQYLIAMGLPLTTTIEEERQFNISIGIGGGTGSVHSAGYNSSHTDLHGSNVQLNIYREGEHDNDEYRRGKDKTSASGKPPKQIVSKDRGDQPPQHIEEEYDDSEESVEVEPGLGPYPPNQGFRRQSTTPMPYITDQSESERHKSAHGRQETVEVWPASAGETEIQRTYRRKETTVTSTIPVVIGSSSTISGQGSNSSTSYVTGSTRWPSTYSLTVGAQSAGSSGNTQQSSSGTTYSYGDVTGNEKDTHISSGTRIYRHESTSPRYGTERSISSGSHHDRQATISFGDDLTQKQENLGDEHERYMQIGRNQKNSTYHYSGHRDGATDRHQSAGGHIRITSGSTHVISTDNEEGGQQTQDIGKELELTQMQLGQHGSHTRGGTTYGSQSGSYSYGSSGHSRHGSMGAGHTDGEQRETSYRQTQGSGRQTEGKYNSQGAGRLSHTSSHSHSLIDDSEEIEGQQTISAFGLDQTQQTGDLTQQVVTGTTGHTHQGQHSMGTYSSGSRTQGSGRQTQGSGRPTEGTYNSQVAGRLGHTSSHSHSLIDDSEEIEGQQTISAFGLDQTQQTGDLTQQVVIGTTGHTHHGQHSMGTYSTGSRTQGSGRQTQGSGRQTEGTYNSQGVGRLSHTSSHSHTLIDDSEEIENQQTIPAFSLDQTQQTGESTQQVVTGTTGHIHHGQHSLGTYSTGRTYESSSSNPRGGTTAGSYSSGSYGTGGSSGSHSHNHRAGSSSGGYTTGTSGSVYMSTGGLSHSTSHSNNKVRTSEDLEGQQITSDFGLDHGQQTEDMTQKVLTGSSGSNYQRQGVGGAAVNYESGRNRQGSGSVTGGYSSGSYSSSGSRSYGHTEGSVTSGSATDTSGSIYEGAGSLTSQSHHKMQQNSEEIEGQQTISAFGLDHAQTSENMAQQSSTGNSGSIYARHGSGKAITVVVGPSHTHQDSGSTAGSYSSGSSYGMSSQGQRESSTSGGYSSGSYSSRGSQVHRGGISSDDYTAGMTSQSQQRVQDSQEIDGQQTIAGFGRGQKTEDTTFGGSSGSYYRQSAGSGGVVTGTSGGHGNDGHGSYSGSYSSRSSSTNSQRQGSTSGANAGHIHDGEQTTLAFELDRGQKTEDTSSGGSAGSYHRHSTGSGGVLTGTSGGHGNDGHGSYSGSYSSRSSSTYSQRQGSTVGTNAGHIHDVEQTTSAYELDRGQKTEDMSFGGSAGSYHRHSTGSGGVVTGTSSGHGNDGHGSYSGSYSSTNSQRQGSASGGHVGHQHMGESEELGGQQTISAFDHGQKSEDMTQQFIDLGQETEDIRQQLQSQQGTQQSYNYGSSRHSHGSYTGHSSHQSSSDSSEYNAQVEEVTTEVNIEEKPGFWKRVGQKAKDVFG